MEIFKWKNHSFKGNAEIVAGEINDLGESVNPQDIVNYARNNPESELFKCFTWDDSKAAENWRLQEARIILCNLVKVEVQEDTTKEPLRVFFKTTNDEGYKPTKMILSNQDEYQNLLARAKNELYAFEKKYNSLCELGEVFEAINNL